MAEQDLWALWPDGYMASLSETKEMKEALATRSDDYVVVAVLEYDEASSPCRWRVVR